MGIKIRGFRVSGYAPRSSFQSDRISDDFELRHVAIEHARRLNALGWRDVLLDAIVVEDGVQYLDNVQWRVVGEPA